MGGWEFYWYIIVNVTYNMLIIWPISQDNFISSISYCSSDICFVVVKFEFTYNIYLFIIFIYNGTGTVSI